MLTAALFVLAVWWGATQALLWLTRLAPAPALNALAAAIGVLSVAAAVGAGDLAGRAGAYGGFMAGLGLWAALEMAFLSGAIVGLSARTAPPPTSAVAAFLAIIWHESALLAALALLAFLVGGTANEVAFYTFGLLYVMRVSAKLNLFLGVRNACPDFLPPAIAHLARHFRAGPMNALFPFSVLAGTLLTAFLARGAFAPGQDEAIASAYALLAALSALGTIEHWLMVTPLSPQSLFTPKPLHAAPKTGTQQRGGASRPPAPMSKAYT